MPTLLMNDRAVAGLRSTQRTTYFDEKTTGLALRVGKRTRAWYFTYRAGGDTEWVKLGTYPALGLAEARDLVLEKRHGLDIKGIDPAVERRKAPEPEPAPAFTFGDFAKTFVEFQKGRIQEWRADEQKIERYLLPAWRTLPLASITRRHIHELLDSIVAKGLTVGVNRIQSLISRMFTVALDRHLVDAHPVARMIKRFGEVPRDRVLDEGELRQLWAGLDAQPGAASDAMRLRVLLGQRGKETALLRWAELDLDEALWTLPRRRTKTKKRTHFIGLPLQGLAIDLLNARRAALPADEPRVFPGLTLQGDEHRALGVIHGGTYTWKDVRRTMSTYLGDLGYDDPMIGRVLNHARAGVTSRHYNHAKYVAEIRAMLTAWDTELQRILRNEPKPKARILPMPSRS
jgi:integrase